MKDKYFDINRLYVGCLGTIDYIGNEEWANWSKKTICPYAIYREVSSDSLDNCHEGINIFSGDKYYYLNEISRKKSTLEIVHGNYIIGKSIPMNIVCGNDKRRISSIELKSIMCNFNLTDALIKNRNDGYLHLLRRCLNDIDLMGEGKVKEYYIDNMLSLIYRYTSISFAKDGYDSVIEDINDIRHKLDREREIFAKKYKKNR